MKINFKILNLFIFLITNFFIFSPVIVLADPTWIMPDPNIKISDELTTKLTEHPECTTVNGKTICKISWLSEYIAGIYKYSIGAVAILATVVMMIGGVVWITAGGSQTRIGEAKQYISGSLTGLVLVFCSYMILNIVNPDLVKFKPVEVEIVNKTETGGCCIYEAVISTNPLKMQTTCRHISRKTCDGFTESKYTANARCSTSATPACIKNTSEPDTGVMGCCAFDFSGETRCRNNYTEKRCEEKYGAAMFSWDEGITCSENSSCDNIDP